MIAPAKNETPPETIDSDLQCGTCEYNLRTLPRDGACPECGRPLRESIMPRDLRFPSMGAIRRTRIGIACLILGLAVPAAIKIPLTLVTLASPLFWDQRSDHQSPISKLFRATSHAWYLGPELATVISAVGIILITVPLTRRSRRFSPRLGILTALFACVSAPCAAYSLAAKLPFSLGASSGAEWILTSGFDNVAAIHIDEVALSAVALDALRGLVALEPGLEVDRAGDRVNLRLDGGELGGVGLPSSQAPAEWARATVAALELVRKSSSRLRQASVERIIEVMLDSALAGLDRYSRYASPEEARENRAIREGFGGIGVTLERFDHRILIVSVIADAPAARAGIKANDHLLKVDETAVDDLDVADIVRLVRGP
ncbi:MAG: PDZ domain-containing protein, partial [Planctomycetes bacterium]|nr:PDZ domain-containing protein [Planctomycetota bacterium]